MIVKDDSERRAQAAAIVAGGCVIAFLTDTFYGLGADPLNADAVRRIKNLKGRDDHKPILLLISDLAEVDRFIEQSDFFKLVAQKHWPAPLTLIGAVRSSVPAELTAGTGSLGVRLPDNENVRRLVRVCGGALTATSANVSGQPPARTAREVAEYFSAGIDLIVDGGEATVTEPSTVLDVSNSKPRLVREGLVTRDELAQLFTTAAPHGASENP
jgi:L-threonylcarbamoyladenylate synthase